MHPKCEVHVSAAMIAAPGQSHFEVGSDMFVKFEIQPRCCIMHAMHAEAASNWLAGHDLLRW